MLVEQLDHLEQWIERHVPECYGARLMMANAAA
jgi:hypothetical protein